MAFFSALTDQLKELYSKLFPIPCLLCGDPAGMEALCEACCGDLPQLGQACERCARPLSWGQICGNCLRTPPLQTYSFSMYRYDPSVKRCITAFKFHGQLQLGRLFSHQMAAALSARESLPDCLVPIPLHPRRLRLRGYNQAQELARALAEKLGIDCRNDILSRCRYTQPQSQLNFQQRQHNLKQAFRCHLDKVPAHIALVDDVMTSGHTSSEAAHLLKAHGAEIIEVWTIARAISHY